MGRGRRRRGRGMGSGDEGKRDKYGREWERTRERGRERREWQREGDGKGSRVGEGGKGRHGKREEGGVRGDEWGGWCRRRGEEGRARGRNEESEGGAEW